MSKPKRTPRATARPLVKTLPPALAKNAARSASAKRARLAAEGHADVALIRARKARIVEDFYDIGEALARLKRPGVAEAMGHAGFAALCRAELDMSATKAAKLMGIVQAIPREHARKMGQERAAALLALAEATPEDDTAMSLTRGTLGLPSGKKIDLAKASTRELLVAAKDVRTASAKRAGKATRGVTTTSEERAAAAALEAALHRLGVEEARVTAVAKAGAGAQVRIERVPVAKLSVLKKALGEVGAKKGG